MVSKTCRYCSQLVVPPNRGSLVRAGVKYVFVLVLVLVLVLKYKYFYVLVLVNSRVLVLVLVLDAHTWCI